MIKRILLAASIAALSCAAFAQKVSELPAGTAVGGTEMIPAVQTGSTVRLTPAQLDTYISATTKTLTNKSISGASNTITNVPISTGVSGLGTGVATALGIAVGSAGAPVVLNGALGTPSSGSAANLTGLPLATGVTGTLQATNFPALTGDVTTVAGALGTTLATVNSNVGSFGSATQSLTATVNGKGLVTAISAQTVTPAVGSITGLGTGVATFLATPSSANLAAALTDENGSGKVQFSAGTLDIASGKTATISNTLTFTGTDSSSIAFGTGGTVDYVLTPTAVKTSNYSAVAGDLVPVDTTSGSVTITLPTAPADKSMISVKQIIRGGTNTVSVVTGGSDVFNRSAGPTTATLTLTGQAGTYQYKASGAIWYIIADDMPYASILGNAQTWTGIQTLTTPVLGVATGTSLALGGCTIGSNALCATGTANFSGALASGPQTITGAVGASAIAITGATQTSSFPVLDATQTWSNASTTFTGIKLNVTDTNSAAASLLIDLQVGAVSKFSVTKAGLVTIANGLNVTSSAAFSSTLGIGASQVISWTGQSKFWSGADAQFTFDNAAQTQRAILTVPTSAIWQHGAADAASPVAQTIKFQDVVAGTSNTAGVNATIQAPAGTGTGAGGSLIFQVAPAGSTGTAKNAFATALTIDSTKLATFAGAVSIATTLNVSSSISTTAMALTNLRVSNIITPDNSSIVMTATNGSANAVFGGSVLSATHDRATAGVLTIGGTATSLVIPTATVTSASSGTRYLCISTAGVVTSSASACSGT